MARINVEQNWWTDLRRFELIEACGGNRRYADGLMLEVWHTAIEFYGNGGVGIPESVFVKIDDHELVMRCGLVKKVGKIFYVNGSKQHFEWLKRLRCGQSKGGKSLKKKSAATCKSPTPTPTPTPTPVLNTNTCAFQNNELEQSSIEHTSTTTPPPPEGGGSPGGDRDSENLKKGKARKTRTTTATENKYAARLEELYKRYPRKLGKANGLKSLYQQIQSDEDLANLEKALNNFLGLMRSEKRDSVHLPYFSTWANSWRDYFELDQQLALDEDVVKKYHDRQKVFSKIMSRDEFVSKWNCEP